jgi:AcrR family transcriptional regulator
MHDTDRRVIYTKKLLRDSLMDLMQEKNVSRISVTELCKGAGVNRGTFYSHYRQPEDVLTSIEEELFNDINDILASNNNIADIHRAIVYSLYRNRDAYRILISPNGDPGCIERLLDISKEYFASHTLPALNSDDPEIKYMHSFMFSGIVAVLKEWLAGGALITPDEIAEVITRLQEKILKNA